MTKESYQDFLKRNQEPMNPQSTNDLIEKDMALSQPRMTTEEAQKIAAKILGEYGKPWGYTSSNDPNICYCTGKCRENGVCPNNRNTNTPNATIVYKGVPAPTADPEKFAPETGNAAKIIKACDEVRNLLLEKNRRYGDSALNSGIVFDLSPVIAIKARINDKLARLKNDNKDEDEDIIKDLLGYLILLKIAIEDAKK